MEKVIQIKHPLIDHKLSILRESKTPGPQFRLLLKEISLLLLYEVTRDLSTVPRTIETPLETMQAPTLTDSGIVLVSVLRAGNGLLEGALELIPSARVGFVGLFRDENTLKPVEYYYKMPASSEGSEMIILDPMLATGHSLAAAINKVKKEKPKRIKVVSLLAAPEGVAYLAAAHPDVEIYIAAIDRQLNENGYILPGLGDAGDRLFGTE